jgi:radical SAM protein with 4Fe4S-binding SPASM domain
MQACIGGQITPDYPYKLYLDITQDCNMYCKMCRDSVQVTGKTMPFDLFCRLVDETAPYVKSYSLFNWGEPLILEDFQERVRYVFSKKRSECKIDISTNGMLMSDEIIRFLREMNVLVTVSFDGADKTTFERIRRGADFDRICRTLQKLSAAYSGLPLTDTPEIYIAIQKDNQNQLREIAKLVFSLGIRRIGFGLVTGPADCAAETNDDLRREIERTTGFITDNGMLNTLYPTKAGDYLWWGNQYVHMDNFILDTTCNAPFISATVAYNGDVYLCCNGGDVAGNILDRSFIEIWQSKRYNDLRAAVNSNNDKPGLCRNCAWFNR